MTKARYSYLEEVNASVNETMRPMADIDLYGYQEYWTLSYGSGDCEDYAIRKRHELMMSGWPVGSLLLAVGRDEDDEGHAWLVVRTTDGDLVLDNRTNEILSPSEAPYAVYSQQSSNNPRIWLLKRSLKWAATFTSSEAR